MKVPVLDGPRVEARPVGTPYVNTDVRGAFGQAVAKGLEDVGQGVDQAIEADRKRDAQLAAAAAKAKKEADEFRVDSADLEFGQEINHNLHEKDVGFLNKQGEAALNEAPTLEAFGKAREKIAKALSNDEQRSKFNQRAQARMQQAWTRVESHAAEQRLKVYESAASGQVQLALDTVALSRDPKDIDSAIGKVLVGPDGEPGPLRRFLTKKGLPTEKIEAEESEFKAKAYGIALQGFLDRRDAAGAEEYFRQVKDQLGPHAKQLAKDVALVALDSKADMAADLLVKTSRNPDGSFNAAEAYARVNAIGDQSMADEVRQRVQKREMVEDRLQKDYVKSVGDRAFTQHNVGGFTSIPGPLREELNRVDPPLYDRLKYDAARKRHQSKQEQAMANLIALQDFMSRPVSARAEVDPDRDYAGFGLDEVGMGAIRVKARVAKDEVRKDGGVSETEFLRTAKAAATNIVKGKEDQKLFDGEAALAYDKLKARLKGAEPTAADVRQEISELLQKRLTKPGMLFGFNEETEFKRRARERKEGKPPAPATAPKPSKRDRALQLQGEGKSNAEIAKALTAEGY